MRVRTRLRLAIVTCSISLACSSAAFAQTSTHGSSTRDDPTGAHAHYEQGRSLYLQGRFLEAAHEFRAAYEATLEPAFLYNAAMALYDGGDLAAARDAFRAYLREHPSTPNRAVIEQRVATIDRRLREASASVAPGGSNAARRTPSPGAETERAPLAWAGLAIGVAGLVAVGVGAGLYANVDGTYQRCVPNLCDPSEQPRALDAASVAMLWGGGALALAGTALFLFVPRVRIAHAPSAFGIDPRGGVVATFRF
jgi:tetratricopeptide (TPR) repeat protein